MAMSTTLESLAKKFEGEYTSAKEANLKRYQEAMGMYDEIIEQYKPGGGFGAGFEAQLGATKKKDTGTAMQQQISSGLYGVQSTGGISNRWEAEVGSPARLQLEDMRMGRYSEAMMNKAGAVERREDEYPDSGLIAQLYSQAAQVGSMGSMPSGGSGGGSSYEPYYPSRSTMPSTSQSTAVAKKAGTYLPPNTLGNVQPSQAPADPKTYNSQPIGGSTGRVLKATPTEQKKIDTNLQTQYPQMSQPGWGGVGTTSAVVKATPTEQKKITSNLQAMYPQMYQPGWGKKSYSSSQGTSLGWNW